MVKMSGDGSVHALKIWIDGDALPGEVRDIILRAAQRLRVAIVLVANKNLHVPAHPLISFVRVAQGPDVADAYILDSSTAGDFCITADIPLAALLVAKGLTVIDPRGDLYSEETVGERLAIRDWMTGLREAGVQTGGPPPFDAKAKQRFAARFDHLITKALRGQ
jgi:uncharacterized protein YaiI (UPF0178 family)